jgi:hypothetical protein
MSLISRLVHTIQSWRRPRGGQKTNRRADLLMEHLDHRQLLSVNFTGNVATDFPASTVPGVVVVTDPNNVQPSIAPQIAPIVKVSGFAVSDLRVSYDQADDTLSVGFEGPPSDPAVPSSHQVIAGDADNNGNDGTVNPALLAVPNFSGFKDNNQFGGSEAMAAVLDLNGSGTPDIVAGYSSTDARPVKEYQVAVANTSTSLTTPDFGTELPQFEGNVYKNNSAVHPNLEIDIAHFSTLYLQETGKALTSDSIIKIGAYAGSQEDLGIGEQVFHPQNVQIGPATFPDHACPPASPPIAINYHENAHINTAHDTLVRVNIIGSSGFDVTKIDPASVTLGGAHAIFGFDRHINKDQWLDATFVFRGSDINLPSGWTEATVTGNLTDGTSFSSTTRVFNRDDSFYPAKEVLAAEQRRAARDARHNGFIVLPPNSPIGAESVANADLKSAATVPIVQVKGASIKIAGAKSAPAVHVSYKAPVKAKVKGVHKAAPLKVSYTAPKTPAAAPSSLKGPVIKIAKRTETKAPAPKVSSKVQSSLNKFVRSSGAVDLNTGQAVGGAT